MDNSSIARQSVHGLERARLRPHCRARCRHGEIVLVGSGTRFVGPEGVKEFDRMWADAFPDGKVEIDELISAGDTVVVEYTGRGTQTGTLRSPGGDIPPTGRSITLRLRDVIRISDGKITSLKTSFDSASLLTQLGVMPGAGVATA